MVAIAKPEYIVAEITKNWIDGQHATDDTRLLSEKFEEACNANAGRGYTLDSWNMHSVILRLPTVGKVHSETIIAVFKRCKPA